MRAIVSRQPELDIVGEVATEDMPAAIQSTQPDVVVIGNEADRDCAPLALLRVAHPQLRVVVIDDDGHKAALHAPGCGTREVAQISPDTLLDLLRGGGHA